MKTDGTVWVWGANFLISNNPGQLTVPVQIPGLTNVTAITAGSNHLLMLKSDKTVWAIGGNNSGELGDGTTTSRTTPVQVVGFQMLLALPPVQASVWHLKRTVPFGHLASTATASWDRAAVTLISLRIPIRFR